MSLLMTRSGTSSGSPEPFNPVIDPPAFKIPDHELYKLKTTPQPSPQKIVPTKSVPKNRIPNLKLDKKLDTNNNSVASHFPAMPRKIMERKSLSEGSVKKREVISVNKRVSPYTNGLPQRKETKVVTPVKMSLFRGKWRTAKSPKNEASEE